MKREAPDHEFLPRDTFPWHACRKCGRGCYDHPTMPRQHDATHPHPAHRERQMTETATTSRVNIPGRKSAQQRRDEINAEIALKVERLGTVNASVTEMTKEKKELQGELLNLMDRVGLKTTDVVTAGDGVQHKLTVVEPESTYIDEDRLQTVVGAKLWAKITRRVLDTSLLEGMVTSGAIPAGIVAGVSTIKAGTRHVRLTNQGAPKGKP